MNTGADTFFRPDEVSRKHSTLPAQTYNQIRLLLSRSPTGCQFVPIRTLQYMGVITRNEVIFVDSLNYAVREGEGGRMIMIAWEFGRLARDSLNDPLSFEVVHYCKNMDDIELRLYREFARAMEQVLGRRTDEQKSNREVNVVSLPSSFAG